MYCIVLYCIDISDHIPQFSMIPHSNSKHLPKNNTIFVRKYKKLNVEKFTTELNQVDWSFTSSDSETSVHEDASKFISIIDSLSLTNMYP